MVDDARNHGDRWQRIETIFHEASRRPAEQRPAFLAESCGDDESLRRDVERLLEHADAESGGLSELVWDDSNRSQRDALADTAGAGTGATSEATIHHDRLVGRTVGHFRIIDVIAAGGMGTVYRAQQDKPRRRVALKVISPGIASRGLLRRLEQEAQVLGRLQHPGIAQIFEAGSFDTGEGAQPYFAMEYIGGDDLLVYAQKHGLGTRQRLELMARICSAVQHAHQRGVIHRDLKPGNILVDESGQPKVLDFGVARATDADVQTVTLRTDIGQLIGTVPYMSPEQAGGDPYDIDVRSDVYALGVVMYELLSGRLPYNVQEKMIHEAVRVIREDDPTPLSTINPSFRGDVETILIKALDKDKSRRYQSAADLEADIRRYLHDEPISARPPSAMYQLGKFARRNKALVAGVAATIAVLVIGIVATGLALARALDAERLAGERLIDAERQARVAREVNAFLNRDLLALADPNVLPQEEVTIRSVLDIAAERIEGRFPDEPLVEASVRATLGNTYASLGEYDVAERHLDRAVALHEDSPDDEAGLLRAKADRAALWRLMGRYREAGAALEAVLAAQRTQLGDDHEETLRTMERLADAYRLQGRASEAVALIRPVYEIRRRRHGTEHIDTIIAAHQLGDLLRSLGRLDESEALFMRTIEASQAALGTGHPRTLQLMGSLGNLHRSLSDYARAETLFAEALQLERELLGPEHPNTLETMFRLAGAKFGLTKLDEAEALYRNVADVRRRVLGAGHLRYATVLSSLTRCLMMQGKFEEVQDVLRELKAIMRRRPDDFEANPYELYAVAEWHLTCDPLTERDPAYSLELIEEAVRRVGDNPDMLYVHALAKRASGDLAGAVLTLDRGLELIDASADPLLAATVRCLQIRLLQELRRADDSAVVREAEIELVKRAAGSDAARVYASATDLAVRLIELDRLVLFECFAEELARLRRGVMPGDEPPAAAMVATYARAMTGRGERDLARDLLQACLAYRRVVYEPGHVHTNEIEALLADLESGDPSSET